MMACSATVAACAAAGRWELALAVLAEVSSRGPKPDVVACNAALSALATGQKWDCALAVLTAMPSAGLQPDQVSYRMPTETASSCGQWTRSLVLFDVMAGLGLPVDRNHLSVQLKECEQHGLHDREATLLSGLAAAVWSSTSIQRATRSVIALGQSPQVAAGGFTREPHDIGCWIF